MLKRLLLVFAVVFTLHMPAIASAQDADTPTPQPEATITELPATDAPTLEPTVEPTPEPEPEPEPGNNSTLIINGLLIALVIVFVFAGGMFVVLFRTILGFVPSYLQPVVRDVTLRGLDELGRRVRETPDTLDDELFKIIDERMRKILNEELPVAIAKGVNQAIANAQSAQKYNPPQS